MVWLLLTICGVGYIGYVAMVRIKKYVYDHPSAIHKLRTDRDERIRAKVAREKDKQDAADRRAANEWYKQCMTNNPWDTE